MNSTEKEFLDYVREYSKQWKWFLLSVIICLSFAILNVRYTSPEYESVATIQIIEDKNSGSIDILKDLDIFSGGKKIVEDEVIILKSRSNILEVVKDLGINTKILVNGNIRDNEIYSNAPLRLNFISEDSIIDKANIDFSIQYSSSNSYTIQETVEGIKGPSKSSDFGNKVPTSIGDIIITPVNPFFENFYDVPLKIEIRPINSVARGYRNKIDIQLVDQYSNILSITLQDKKIAKSKDIINSLIKIYNKNSITDKMVVANRTSNFIDERISEISRSLSTVDQTAEEFKSDRGLTDISSQSNINLNVGASTQQDLSKITTELNMASSMKEIVDSQDKFDVLPSNIGLSDQTIVGTTQQYNQLVLERERLLKSSNEKNPIIVNLDQQLRGLRNTMRSSLNSTVNNLELQMNTLSRQNAIINSRIYSAPKNERQLRDITRQQQTTESLYLYLLQKREEAKVAAASSSPRSKIIDAAYSSSSKPVSPRKRVIFLASIIMGFLIPFSFFYVKSLVDNKVQNMDMLQKIAGDIPVLGELPGLGKKEDKLVIFQDRSVLAEALRIIRTNLDYLLKSRSQSNIKSNIIFITSGVSGEGKTFLSTNLSMILSSTQKKVLLIGADIRNPKFYSFFVGKHVDNISNKRKSKERDLGLTDYLLDKSIDSMDIIKTMLVHNNEFDVIYSGKMMPNPAELLLSNRINVLFEEVSEKYDYVIVDTAPIMLVTDTLLINSMASQMIYVVRAGVTEKKSIEYPINLKKEGKINSLSFVVNDVKKSNLGYGGKYGYGYGNKKTTWYKF